MDNAQLLQAISDLMDKKFDERLSPINNRLDKMDSRFETIESRLDKMDSRFEAIESRLDKMESEISAIKIGQAELRKDMKELKLKVNETYELALDAWGQSTKNRVWLDKTLKM